MKAKGTTKYRAMVARCNFLPGSDHPDLQFAAMEASRRMSKPCYDDMDKVIRIANYLNGEHHRLVQILPFGRDDGVRHAWSGLDWAGCRRTRKSTSGGVLRVGSCTIKHWSSTQKAIALSSSEVELYAATRAISEAKGLRSLVRDLVESLRVLAWVGARSGLPGWCW